MMLLYNVSSPVEGVRMLLYFVFVLEVVAYLT